MLTNCRVLTCPTHELLRTHCFSLTDCCVLTFPTHELLRIIGLAETRELLDHALVLWLPGPNSQTGASAGPL
jgi:tRNA U34 5-carboxymethylaminomethyl modifying GTPase MnmE/TrmE